MRLPYRIAQFRWAISADVLPSSACNELVSFLSAKEWDLFQLYSSADQRHGYQVYQTLHAAGYHQTDLLVAGILHDIGKTKVKLSVWERIVVVIGGVLFPQKILAWGQGKAEGWKRPFVVKVQHPVWGAEMAQAAGSSERVVNLIRRHQDPLPSKPSLVEDELLCLLQWADDQN